MFFRCEVRQQGVVSTFFLQFEYQVYLKRYFWILFTDKFNLSFRLMEGMDKNAVGPRRRREGMKVWSNKINFTQFRNNKWNLNSLSIYTLYVFVWKTSGCTFLSFQIEDFETSITRFLLLLSIKAQKVQYLNHLLIIHPNFSVNLPIVIIYKFCKILIQPPGEPREHHLGEVRPKRFELHKMS